MPEDETFECPECGASITTEMSNCPSCRIELEWEDEEEIIDDLEDSTDKLLKSVEDYEVGTEPQGDVEIPEEDLATAPEEPPPTPAKGPKRYVGLSIIGLVFALLTVVAVIGTVVLLNYDTWIDGADENNIGDTQIMYVYAAVAGIVVCALIVVFDFVRNRKAA